MEQESSLASSPAKSPSKNARRRANKRAKGNPSLASSAPLQPSPTSAVPATVEASYTPPFGSLLDSELFCHAITFKSDLYQPLAFLTAAPIAISQTLKLHLPQELLFEISEPVVACIRMRPGRARAAALKRFNTAIFNMLFDRRFSCPREHGAPSSDLLEDYISDDPLGFLFAPLKPDFKLDAVEEAIDWDLVETPWTPLNRADSASLPTDSFLPAPFARRLCKESRLFRLIRPRPDLNLAQPVDSSIPMLVTKSYRGKVTLRDWFEGPDFGANLSKLPRDDWLLEIAVTKSPARYTSQEEWKPLTGSANDERLVGVLPASVLRKSRLSDSFWQTLFLLPSVVRLITDHLQAVKARSMLQMPTDMDAKLIMQALTPVRSNSGYDYERLEILGDGFLKMASSVHLYRAYPKQDERFYSQQRQRWTDNASLQGLAIAAELPQLLLVESFDPPFWIPAPAYGQPVKHIVFKDELSDGLEALLGAAWLHIPQTALQLAGKLGLQFGTSQLWHVRDAAAVDGVNTLPASDLHMAQSKLGYSFRQPALLCQALTHHSTGQPDYERLEFLGDAILDCFMVDRLYHLYPSMKPGQITVLKGVVVCNSSLAFQTHKLGLVKLIREKGLSGRFAQSCVELDRFDESRYWDAVWLGCPSKIIADVFEAIIGAILVDSGYRLEPVFDFLSGQFEALIRALPCDYGGDPVSRLMRWSQARGCNALAQICAESVDSFACEVFVHDDHVSSASHASADVAAQLASTRALARLQEVGYASIPCTCSPSKAAASPTKLQLS